MSAATAQLARVSLFAKCCDPDGRGWDVVITSNCLSHQVHIIDPFVAQQEADLKWYLEKYARKDPFAETKADVVEKSLESYSRSLHDQLKPAFTEIKVDGPLQKIYLAISDHTNDMSIHRLHWETLETPVLPCNISVYRTQEGINIEPSNNSSNKKESLNLLFMTARKMVRTDVDQRLILRPVLSFIADKSSSTPVEYDVVQPGTFEALTEWLSQRKGYYDMIHFDVHGVVREGRAMLLFSSATEPEEDRAVEAQEVGNLLHSVGVRFVFLNACDSAVSNSGMAANLALEFLRCGVSMVIGMSYMCLIRAADIFTRHFYESLLVQRNDVLTSIWQARCALREDRSREARFGLNVEIDDWVVPVFYSQQMLDQNSASNLGLYLDNLPKILPAEWNSAKTSNDAGITTIIGREYDALLVENLLAKKNGFIHLFGPIGVGKTTLIDDTVSWWQLTKYVRSHVKISTSELLNQPMATVLDQLMAMAKSLSATNRHSDTSPLSTRDERKSKSSSLTNNNFLIVVDQAEDYLQTLDDEKTLSFSKALSQFHSDINQLYPTLMIIASSCNMQRLFDQMTLDDLQDRDALNLALKMSPKVFEACRINDKEVAFCKKLAQSLTGNPLAIKLVFSALEQSFLQSSANVKVSELILSIWTGGFKGQIWEHSPTIKERFDRFLSQLRDEQSEMMLSLLSPFKQNVPRDLSMYFDRLIALKVLPDHLVGSAENSFLNKGGCSKEFKPFQDLADSVFFKLNQAGFIYRESSEIWILHPLLPYLLSLQATNFSLLDMGNVMNANADWYMVRTRDWKIGTDKVVKDMEYDYLNFISSFWKLANPSGISIGTPAPWYLVDLMNAYDVGDESNNPEMVIAVALCVETLNRFEKSLADWEHSLAPDLIYRPIGGYSEAKEKEPDHKNHNCPCKALLVLITVAMIVEDYYTARTNSEVANRVHLQRSIDLWNLHEKHFGDDFHHQINCGAGGNALMQVGVGYLQTFCLSEALENLSRAQKLLQDSLVTYPGFDYQLGMCSIYLERTQMLIANHGARDPTILNWRNDEMRKLTDDMWKSGPEIQQPVKPFHDQLMREVQDKSFETDVISVLAKDIDKPGSKTAVFRRLRQAQLDNLDIEIEQNSIPAQIQSKLIMALAASRTQDYKGAQRLNEDILDLLDKVDFGTRMERRLEKFQYHINAAQAATSARAYGAAIGHLQKGYDIMHAYELVHDTRWGMYKVLSMASNLPKDVLRQVGGLSPVTQDLRYLMLLYDPTLQESADFRKQNQSTQDYIKLKVFSKEGQMRGSLFKAFYFTHLWDTTQGRFQQNLAVVLSELLNTIGANTQAISEFIFVEYFKVMNRIPLEVLNLAERGPAYLTAFREMERALFAPVELRKDFLWLDRKYEEQGLRRRWPKGYDNKAESERRLDLIKWRFLMKLRSAVALRKNLNPGSIESSEPTTYTPT